MTDHIWGLDLATEALRAVVLLNGYPVFMPTDTGGRMTSVKLNPWIVEGSNRLQVRLGRVEDGAELAASAHFRLDAYYAVHGERPAVDAYVARYQWAAEEQELVDEGMTEVLDVAFEVDRDRAFGRWAWQDAAVYEEGERVAIEALVGRCRQALVHKDLDSLLALLSLFAFEMSTALGIPADEAEQDLRDFLQPYFDEAGWSVAPIDYGVVSLVPVASGKVVLVMGPRGEAVLRGQVIPEEGQEPVLPPIGMPLAVSNLGGTWTVVR